MRQAHFPLSSLPAWCALNGVTVADVKVGDVPGRGLGLMAERDLVNDPTIGNNRPLLTIPRELVLSAEGVEEYARENKDFRQLLDAAGRRSSRCDILLFLLMQLVLSSPDYTGKQGPTTPWTQYFSVLPTDIPVPTTWTEAELSYLRGTSLEAAVSAKLTALTKEFDDLKVRVAELPFWNELLCIDEAVTIRDWVWLDALYRSRSLELPRSGESMVPCLDMANHSGGATAYYDETTTNEITLLLHENCKVAQGSEITINYGQNKPAAEMLFTYGFVDAESPARGMVLPLEPMADDPLAKAKLLAFGRPPLLEIKDTGSISPEWHAPFVYLACLNEEDGLDFKVLQETDGSRHLTMFWQEVDITEEPKRILDLIREHELHPIFHLRAVTIVLDTVEQQLLLLSADLPTNREVSGERPGILQAASYLRTAESELLRRTRQSLNDQRDQLLADDTVVKYLGSMDTEPGEGDGVVAPNDNEDFS
ncbi:hypothetical protein F4780DRAFT_768886 [Xylariomycetidae sp. FL0641]|nr:hypothetical protein F4780DRAFT_768886 [Xylariomycetidae sp. FL0641]